MEQRHSYPRHRQPGLAPARAGARPGQRIVSAAFVTFACAELVERAAPRPALGLAKKSSVTANIGNIPGPNPGSGGRFRAAARSLAALPPAATRNHRPTIPLSLRAKVRKRAMTDHVYKIVELVGSSPTSIEDAIQSAIARASSTVDNIRWFEVLETRGHVEGGKVSHYQVTLKVGFTVKA
jgi:dodecin